MMGDLYARARVHRHTAAHPHIAAHPPTRTRGAHAHMHICTHPHPLPQISELLRHEATTTYRLQGGYPSLFRRIREGSGGAIATARAAASGSGATTVPKERGLFDNKTVVLGLNPTPTPTRTRRLGLTLSLRPPPSPRRGASSTTRR